MLTSIIRKVPLVFATLAFAGWYVLLAPMAIGGPATYVWVSGDSMEPTLRTGDLVVLRRADTYRIGEVIAFRVPAGEPAAGNYVIHRIVGGSDEAGFITQGDNKERPDRWRPTPADIVGVETWTWSAGARVIGWLRDPAVFAAVAAGLTVFVIMLGDIPGAGVFRRPKQVLVRLRGRSERASA